ncbi:MAG: PorT family protein [Chitinophagaceae bacterium]|nr:MAG: PorT family protein [Chitinophagaceae bacterium]
MKQILLITAVIFIAVSAGAQNRVLLFGGPQLSSAFYSADGKEQQVSSRPGFHLGTTLKVPFENHLYFAPSLFYSMKGYKVRLTEPSTPPDSLATSNETRIHTLEIAPLLQIDFSMKPDHFFVRFGPSIDVQLAGRETFTLQDKTTISRKMKYSFKDYGYVGANVMATFGYETACGYHFGVTYSHGLGSINNVDYGARILHQVVSVSFGKYLKR